MKNFVVYRLHIANALITKGFDLIGTGVNLKNTKYKVFFFEDTPELREEVNKLAASQKLKTK